MTKKLKIPFEFVLDILASQHPITKPMFGCVSVYVKNKIVLILRDKNTYTEDNGVWLATTVEHHKSLKKDFPSMRSIKLFNTEITGWQVLPSDSTDFEEAVSRACTLILENDARIGKIPNRKSKAISAAVKKKPRKRKKVVTWEELTSSK